jgi:hypothetical protein
VPITRVQRRRVRSRPKTCHSKQAKQNRRIPSAIAELKSCLVTQWYRAKSWQLLSELLSKAGQATEAAWARDRAEAYDVHLDELRLP